MEAPEIIWLLPNEYRSNEPSCFWSESQRTDYDIEYVRKDAFIEKATKWLMDNIQNYTDDGMGEHSFVLVQDLKEDFKKYMKGE